jgi:hypothetical protein
MDADASRDLMPDSRKTEEVAVDLVLEKMHEIERRMAGRHLRLTVLVDGEVVETDDWEPIEASSPGQLLLSVQQKNP